MPAHVTLDLAGFIRQPLQFLINVGLDGVWFKRVDDAPHHHTGQKKGDQKSKDQFFEGGNDLTTE